MNPLFSVIIPTYNRANLLRIAIKSVIDQKFDNWELVIVDDGSTDNTKFIVQDFKDSRIKYVYQKNKKLSEARNTGVKNSIGKYICFLDDDDYYLDNHLTAFYKYLSENNYPSKILRTALFYKRAEGTSKGPFYDKKKDGNPLNWAAFNFCGSVTLCVPIEFFQDDLFIAGTEPWEDTHFILRVFAKYPFIQLPDYTYIYIRHDIMSSITIYTQMDTIKRAEQSVKSMKHLFKNYGDLVNPFLPPHTQKYIVSKNYSTHALGSILYGNYSVVWALLKRALKEDPKFYHWKTYLKILLLYPIKRITGYPKIK
ncbi:MAG: glycosyltransferase family 2 protein [Saprospiraceae bacterium]